MFAAVSIGGASRRRRSPYLSVCPVSVSGVSDNFAFLKYILPLPTCNVRQHAPATCAPETFPACRKGAPACSCSDMACRHHHRAVTPPMSPILAAGQTHSVERHTTCMAAATTMATTYPNSLPPLKRARARTSQCNKYKPPTAAELQVKVVKGSPRTARSEPVQPGADGVGKH